MAEIVAGCDFVKVRVGPADERYDCIIHSITVTHPGTVISELAADLMQVQRVVIKNKYLRYFPQGLQKLLPNLQILEIIACQLEEITAADLEGFANLKELNLEGNCLTSLPDDLFKHVPQLKEVNLKNNKITLKPFLKHPGTINLQGNKLNICI